ncbi:hypothetical protein [Variovorax saccharolyticus]|uniref:hypothetical protein n=1 Tax=Variovorax saccharolyticus TaxID=3053516 RepID=UPI002578BBFA|nr:hypothetical protein [Variovorax sp. J31P216]MDM0029566.1 hypothetical protein [Variovorax sp. J31P216]
MTENYRRLAVFVDSPTAHHYLWVVLESTDDPAVWLDLETGEETFSSWIEAHEAGNEALLAYVEDEIVGPVTSVQENDEDEDADDRS